MDKDSIGYSIGPYKKIPELTEIRSSSAGTETTVVVPTRLIEEYFNGLHPDTLAGKKASVITAARQVYAAHMTVTGTPLYSDARGLARNNEETRRDRLIRAVRDLIETEEGA